MRLRILVLAVLCLTAVSALETAEAASLGTRTANEDRTPSPSAVRRAERLRVRQRRNDAVEERRQARLRARSNAGTTRTDRVLELTNRARSGEGLEPLAWNPVLARIAQAYAEDMEKRGFFGHEDPDGVSSGERILAGGYAKPRCDCSWMYGTGENLAMGQRTPEEAVEDWLASPGHRENIMREDFEELGVGYYEGHWVQHFGVSKVLP